MAPTPERLGSSRLTRNTEKLFPGRSTCIAGLHVQHADIDAVHLAAQAAAALDRHEQSVLVQADAAAEEQIELVALPDREQTGVLQEERPLLGKSQIEAREVDLLRVDLDLGEVGVVGQRPGSGWA